MYLQLICLIFLLVGISAPCRTDEDCWLNGVCVGSRCTCDAGWKGENCSQLNLLPAPPVGAYGYSPNVTSWGGVPILVDGTYHLYVAEMVDGCGLCTWGRNSRVVHAISKTLEGPYVFHDVALPVWAHNPQIAVDHSQRTPTYLLFHIGNADGGNPVKCNTNRHPLPFPEAPGGVLHTAESPDGPWTPQAPPGLPGNCNNPAPYVFPNGTIWLVCTWSTYTADSWKGPWVQRPFRFTGDGGRGTWEDPFIYRDNRGNWKLFSHVWEGTGPLYAVRVAGFAYSRDGINWVRSPIPQFNNVVQHTNGQTSTYTTRERPKLFFDKNNNPIAMFNGVAGVPNGDKDVCGKDWSYTLVQPIG